MGRPLPLCHRGGLQLCGRVDQTYMEHSFESQIRYSETNASGHLSVRGLINYFQDVSTMQSAAVGQMPGEGEQIEAGWVLSYWHIEIFRRPYFGTAVQAGTFATDFTGAFGRRNFYLRDQDGYVSWADSLWAYVDGVKGRPVRPSKEIVEAYGRQEPFPMEKYGRKIHCSSDIPNVMSEKEAVTVRAFHLDTNRHMNNAWYVQMALTAAGKEPKGPCCIRVEYKYPARMGDVIHPYVCEEEERMLVALCKDDGRPYALVEIRPRD